MVASAPGTCHDSSAAGTESSRTSAAAVRAAETCASLPGTGSWQKTSSALRTSLRSPESKRREAVLADRRQQQRPGRLSLRPRLTLRRLSRHPGRSRRHLRERRSRRPTFWRRRVLRREARQPRGATPLPQRSRRLPQQERRSQRPTFWRRPALKRRPERRRLRPHRKVPSKPLRRRPGRPLRPQLWEIIRRSSRC